MYFVKFLQANGHHTSGDEVEYRLACSGELFNRTVQTQDWRKSDATRMLLDNPFSLVVASRPFDSYPQELCARIKVQSVTETSAGFSTTFLPDKDIVEDASAMLTLLSRRLITPVVKTMVGHVPTPIIEDFKVVAWPRRPLSIITSHSDQKVEFNQPPPVGVDHEALAKFFSNLAAREDAQDIVYAAKQYRTALELIADRPDTAYLALVSVIETLASIELATYEPDKADRIATKANVAKRAQELGLCEAQASEVALAATKGDYWLSRKFVKFCLDRCSVEDLQSPDEVFMVPDFLKPAENDFEKSLKRIYQARSKNLHVALPFPRTAGVGTSPTIDVRALAPGMGAKLEIPPVTWFERVVSIAAGKYLLGSEPKPFIQT